MISLLRKVLAANRLEGEYLSMLRDAAELLQAQREMLKQSAQEIAVWQDRALTAQRATRDLAIAFRVQQETPDIDIRDDLDELVQDLSDSVARLEEHLPR